jgi:hypothetical protein
MSTENALMTLVLFSHIIFKLINCKVAVVRGQFFLTHRRCVPLQEAPWPPQVYLFSLVGQALARNIERPLTGYIRKNGRRRVEREGREEESGEVEREMLFFSC